MGKVVLFIIVVVAAILVILFVGDAVTPMEEVARVDVKWVLGLHGEVIDTLIETTALGHVPEKDDKGAFFGVVENIRISDSLERAFREEYSIIRYKVHVHSCRGDTQATYAVNRNAFNLLTLGTVAKFERLKDRPDSVSKLVVY
jgi:hypothetical protein